MKKKLLLLLLVLSAIYYYTLDFTPAVTKDIYSVDNPVELKSFLVGEFTDHITSSSIGYIGPTSNLDEDIDRIFSEIALEYPYIYHSLYNIHYDYNGYEDDVIVEFNMDYDTTKDQDLYVNTAVDRILNDIIEPQMNSFEKVKAINDYIILNAVYDFETINSPYSPYTLLKEGMGVCQAYTLLAYKMLDQLDFEVMYVVGEAGDDHAWNLVKLDGEWYHLDITWNDPRPDKLGNISYNYFLVNDNYLSKTHKWDRTNYPRAISNRFSYLHSTDSAFTYDNVIYYSNTLDGDKLYKMNIDGSERTKLNNNRSYYICLLYTSDAADE